jgi:hypothetical protein
MRKKLSVLLIAYTPNNVQFGILTTKRKNGAHTNSKLRHSHCRLRSRATQIQLGEELLKFNWELT